MVPILKNFSIYLLTIYNIYIYGNHFKEMILEGFRYMHVSDLWN